MLKWLRRERGQAYLEFALVLPFLVLLVMGTLDLGRALNAYVVVTNAAREGARYGTQHSSNVAGIKAQVIQETTGTGVTVNQGDIVVTCPSGTSPGDPIQVSVTHNFQFIVLWIFGVNTVPVRATAEMEIIQ